MSALHLLFFLQVENTGCDVNFSTNQVCVLCFSVTGLAGYLLRWYGLMALYEVYWTTVKVFT